MRNQLIKLFNDNRQSSAAGSGYRVANSAGEEATVYLYDAIGGWWGITAADFVKDLAAITAPTIRLHINSPGGDVFDARAMATAIRNHPSKVVAQIDGLAASAATYVALSADEVEIADGGFFMIHRAWTLAMGNAGELRDTANLLDKIDASISADYQRKTGESAEQIDAWMGAETWFTAQEALDHGFVDRIGASANVENHWNLSAYAKAPKALTERQPVSESVFDHAAMERRLGMLERC
ncbi:head maturation protease, ClpP-related [Pseudogulbenkiania ferrooxidans]|uniref:ATP-dependent Clp protease proteolytic subunit n=1 Tax=Pseudogulbenkiania ferrooxidans 2002 TaxID=279714 RepID=B9YYU0_9NEIS|nr:head maturation protease, ClpP-related [Pseudogulbenkiania ferrooxidans]EEG10293.1 peptidase S14 ClpP [Pseudogulbenkiania ferrooxidans 2002]